MEKIAVKKNSSSFVIDEEEDEDDGMGPKDKTMDKEQGGLDAHKIGVSKTQQEKNQALAMHVLGGLRKGDSVVISREHLPGAVLFPALKVKVVSIPAIPVPVPTNSSITAPPTVIGGSDLVLSNSSKAVVAALDKEATTSFQDVDTNNAKVFETREILVHRFLVVTRERLMVLDSNDEGVGSTAIVKSNHHLTEVKWGWLVLLRVWSLFFV